MNQTADMMEDWCLSEHHTQQIYFTSNFMNSC